MMVAILVTRHNIGLADAWKATMKEYFMITDFKQFFAKSKSNRRFDMEKLDGLTEHLRAIGVEGV